MLSDVLALVFGAILLSTLYVIGGKLTKSSAGKVGPRPLDVFKSLQWVSTMGHVLGGLVFVFFIAFYARSVHVAISASVVLAIGAAAKELADVFDESDEDWWSSLQDLAGWLFGVLLAWANILAATRLGRLP